MSLPPVPGAPAAPVQPLSPWSPTAASNTTTNSKAGNRGRRTPRIHPPSPSATTAAAVAGSSAAARVTPISPFSPFTPVSPHPLSATASPLPMQQFNYQQAMYQASLNYALAQGLAAGWLPIPQPPNGSAAMMGPSPPRFIAAPPSAAKTDAQQPALLQPLASPLWSAVPSAQPLAPPSARASLASLRALDPQAKGEATANASSMQQLPPLTSAPATADTQLKPRPPSLRIDPSAPSAAVGATKSGGLARQTIPSPATVRIASPRSMGALSRPTTSPVVPALHLTASTPMLFGAEVRTATDPSGALSPVPLNVTSTNAILSQISSARSPLLVVKAGNQKETNTRVFSSSPSQRSTQLASGGSGAVLAPMSARSSASSFSFGLGSPRSSQSRRSLVSPRGSGASSMVDLATLDSVPAVSRVASVLDSQPYRERIVSIEPRAGEADLPVLAFLRASDESRRLDGFWVAGADSDIDEDEEGNGRVKATESNYSSAPPSQIASPRTLSSSLSLRSSPSARSRPRLTASASVKFRDSLADASSDEDEELASAAAFGRIEEDEDLADVDWDALPDPSADLAATVVLSMFGSAVRRAAGQLDPSYAALRAALSRQRGNQCADSRLLCFGLTAQEAEAALRAFERAEVQVSMHLIEATPTSTVLLQTVPLLSAEDAAIGEEADGEEAARLRAQEEFLEFVSALLQRKHSKAELRRIFCEGLEPLSADNKGDSQIASHTRALHRPFNVLLAPRHRAQCQEIAERLRDRGVLACVAAWEDVQGPLPPAALMDDPSADPLPTTFAIQLRLSQGAGYSTDGLVRLVRRWLPSQPALDYLLLNLRSWRAKKEFSRPWTSPCTPTPPRSGSPTAVSGPAEPELSPEEAAAAALGRELARIRAWARQSNVKVLFADESLAAEAKAAAELATAARAAAEKQAQLLAEKKEAEAASAARIAALQSQLAAAEASLSSSTTEKSSLLSRLEEAETIQAKLAAEHINLREEAERARAKADFAASKAAAQAAESARQLAVAQQLKADHAVALSLQKDLSVDTRTAKLFEETARRNVEKQRALREMAVQGVGRRLEKEREAAAAAARAELHNPQFSSASAITAPVFADGTKNAAVVAAEAKAAAAEKARQAASRAAARAQTPGQKMKGTEMFTMNHDEMRQLMAGLKDELGTTAPGGEWVALDGSSLPGKPGAGDAAASGPLAIVPPEEKLDAGPAFAALPLAQQKKIQAAQGWQRAHLPNMLDAVRRTSIVPATAAERDAARKAREEVQRMLADDEKANVPAATAASQPAAMPSVAEDGSASSEAPTGTGSVKAQGSEEKSNGQASIKNALISYTSAGEFDQLTGLPMEDIPVVSIRERMARAEKRIEEVEYDDMYRRYLQPKGATIGSSGGLSKTAKKAKDAKTKRRRTADSVLGKIEEGKGASGQFLAIPDKKKKKKSHKETSKVGTRSRISKMDSSSSGSDLGSSTDSEGEMSVLKPDSSSAAPKRTASGIPSGGLNSTSTKDGTGKESKRSKKSKHSRHLSSLTASVSVLSPPSGGSAAAALTIKAEKKDKRAKTKDKDAQIYWIDILLSAVDLENPFLIGKPDPYVEVYRCRQFIWELVATTEIAQKCTSAHFSSLLMSVEALCNMQLDRKIMFKVFTNNRLHGRSLIGELSISLTQIQENIGSRFKLINPAKVAAAAAEGAAGTPAAGYKHSGFMKFHHAELSVNSTKATFFFPTLNVRKNPANPSFDKFCSCLVRIQMYAEGLPQVGSWLLKDKPDPYLEVLRLLPDGTWDTSANQGAAASASGSSGRALFRSEPAFQTTRPKFPAFIVSFHSLCYGDVNRLIRVRIRHKDSVLAYADLTLKEMALAVGKKFPLKPGNVTSGPLEELPLAQPQQIRQAGTASSAAGLSSSNSSSAAAGAGNLLLRRVQVFSHLTDLPKLCANAGVERRPVPGVSDLPLKQLLAQQALELGADEHEPSQSRSTKEKTPKSRTDEDGAGAAADGSASSSSAAPPVAVGDALEKAVAKVPDNIYRGLHHIREQAAGKFFTAFLPVKPKLVEQRQVAFLMGAHPRLGADSAIGQHFIHHTIFDPHLLPYIWTFLDSDTRS